MVAARLRMNDDSARRVFMTAPFLRLFFEIRAIRTERLLREKTSRRRVGTGAAAAAQRLIAALAALPFERVRVAQLLEHRRVVPDVLEGGLPRAAGADREVTAGVDIAFVGDEADGGAGEAAARHRRQ